MLHPKMLACLFCLFAAASPACAQSGLNTIPTTDIIHLREGEFEIGNDNTSFHAPALYQAPHLIPQALFGVARGMEVGTEWHRPEALGHKEFSFHFKAKLVNEGPNIPRAAFGLMDVGNGQRPTYFIALSKTLDYMVERRHRHLHRKVLGRRIHLGFLSNGRAAAVPFVGLDIELNEQMVVEADWISGPDRALTFGFEIVLPDKRTALNPYLLFSNETHRVEGFALNITRQFRF